MHSPPPEYESDQIRKKESNEKLNRLTESLELVCLSACLFGGRGKEFPLLSTECTVYIFTPQKAPAVTRSWPTSQALIRSSVSGGYIAVCSERRGLVERLRSCGRKGI